MCALVAHRAGLVVRLPAVAGYDITDAETIALEVPADALRSGAALAATARVVVRPIAGRVSLSGALLDNAREAKVRDDSDYVLTLTLTDDAWAPALNTLLPDAAAEAVSTAFPSYSRLVEALRSEGPDCVARVPKKTAKERCVGPAAAARRNPGRGTTPQLTPTLRTPLRLAGTSSAARACSSARSTRWRRCCRCAS